MIERDFERARRRSSWNRVAHFFTGKPSLLLPFDLVRSQVLVTAGAYEGIREIEIDQVVGSVNRYHEFDREFLPKSRESAHRWSTVRQVFESDTGFPPIKVYQIGQAYFVMDGNHRVSVARQLGMKTIEAEVTSFKPNVPIDSDTDIASLLIKHEYSEFLKTTRLDVLRPEQRIEFTRPGRYVTLLEHIAKRRYFLGLERGQEIPYEDAVASWYDSLYRPLVEIFRQEGMLARFPGRTEADLYVWIVNHLYYLREQYGETVGLREAMRDFSRTRTLRTRAVEHVQKLVGPRKQRRARTYASGNHPALQSLLKRLLLMERRGLGQDIVYRVPTCWRIESDTNAGYEFVNPVRYWREAVERILSSDLPELSSSARGEWSREAVIYNLFVRASCSIDHDGDGEIAPINRDGLRETGTFLKAIAMLPYIRSLGCNTVHLLPITRIGSDGRKGSLGSPYAIANPYEIDETLSEPIVRLGPDLEFKAFVEAAHQLGLRVVLEFVFRTAAKDSEWVSQHPEWFYWIRSEIPDAGDGAEPRVVYRSPVFPPEQLALATSMVERGRRDDLPPPPEDYVHLFTSPPGVGTIRAQGVRRIGTTARGVDVRVPGAFADWPPDDVQPPWGDVTYLRLYAHPDFNYIAYNTIRMYDERLAQREHVVEELWDCIAGILPHYQNRFGIDGAMIDMGHALPASLKARIIAGARGVDPSFAIWDENFSSTNEAVEEGYNAVMGNLWWTLHRPEKIPELLKRYADEGMPLPMFAAAENHNTPRSAARSGSIQESKFVWTMAAFLPAIPFVHSGFELGERLPVNTGLDFTPDEAAAFPEHVLPLYNPVSYAWCQGGEMISHIRAVLELRVRYTALVSDPHPGSFLLPKVKTSAGVAYLRRADNKTLLVVGNPSSDSREVELNGVPFRDGKHTDAITGSCGVAASGRFTVSLDAWGCAVFFE